MQFKPIEVFFSYAHEDKDLCDALEKHLYIMKRQKLIEIWKDRDIRPGEPWHDRILAQLGTSRVILLLVSVDFMNSDYCHDVEMARALERRKNGEAIVLPIILRPCFWTLLPFSDLQVLPEGGQPVTKWPDPDDVFLAIAKEIRRVAQELSRDHQPAKRAEESKPPSIFHEELPVALTPFLGRRKEVARVKKLLLRKDVRLLVLHGLGGTGKTRLSLRVGSGLKRKFKNGVCFVSLESVSDPGRVPSLIAKSLDIKEVEGITAEENLRQYLATKEILLLLDGFERVATAKHYLAELLDECLGLTVLVTSRAPLKMVRARHLTKNVRVGPLEAPPEESRLSAGDLLKIDAVKLFVQTVQATDPDFAVTDLNASAVADICRSLDGLPLAIELAATRVTHFSPERVLAELRTSILDERSEGGGESHKGLRAAFTWTYDLLSTDERKLFRRLSVFRGGFTEDTAKRVCDVDGDLGVDIGNGLWTLLKSDLLRPTGNSRDEPRFKMRDILREYGLQRLIEAGEEQVLRRRYAQVFLDLAETADDEIKGRHRPRCLERLDAEYPNLQAALEWCWTAEGAGDLGLRMAGALFWYWNLRARFSEGRALLERALKAGAASHDLGARARALYAVGGLAFLQGHYGQARQWLDESVRLWRELGDQRGLGYALIVSGMTVLSQGDSELALVLEEESVGIFRSSSDRWGLALALNDLGNVFRRKRRYKEALVFFDQSLAIWYELGDTWGIPLTLSNIGFLEIQRDHHIAAREALEKALPVQREVGDKWGRAETLRHLGDLAVRKSTYVQAEELYCESLLLSYEVGRQRFVIGCLEGLALVAARMGRAGRAATLAGGVDVVRDLLSAEATLRERDMRTVTMKDLTARLDEERLQAALAQGRTMDLAGVIAYATEVCTQGGTAPSRAAN